MATSRVTYIPFLRTSAVHEKSGSVIETDAPTDNNGKGELFSPTDLVATALSSCILTIIGIYCEANKINFTGAETEVTKIMESNPRRIGEIILKMDFSANNWDDKTFEKVMRAGKACPVAHSLNENIKITYDLTY